MPRRDPSPPPRRRKSDYDIDRYSRSAAEHSDRSTRPRSHRRRESSTSSSEPTDVRPRIVSRPRSPVSRPRSPTARPRSPTSSRDVRPRSPTSSRNARPRRKSSPHPLHTRRSSLDDYKDDPSPDIRRPSYPGFSKPHSRETLNGQRDARNDKLDSRHAQRSMPTTPTTTESSTRPPRSRNHSRRSSVNYDQRPVSPPLTSPSVNRYDGYSQASTASADKSKISASESSRAASAAFTRHALRRGRNADGKSHTSRSSRDTDTVGSERDSKRTETPIVKDPESNAGRASSVSIPSILTPGSGRYQAEAPPSANATIRYPAQAARPLTSDPRPQVTTPVLVSSDPILVGTDATGPTPKVDYMLLNGGLPYQLPPRLMTSDNPAHNRPRPGYEGSAKGLFDAGSLFTPLVTRLQDIDAVLANDGSVAVATGYRSVTQRLLDRLDDTSTNTAMAPRCICIMCSSGTNRKSNDRSLRLAWTVILDCFHNRRQLPPWPPAFLQGPASSTSISAFTPGKPMQLLDPDLPVQFREHYLAQNDKTKASVDKWLHAQDASSLDDVDDETQCFAILTRLNAEQRNVFGTLMQSGTTHIPDGHASFLESMTAAIQRLNRLNQRPRDPESVIYMMENPQLHDMLMAVAEVNDAEWTIMTSASFDALLSGTSSRTTSFSHAEDGLPHSTVDAETEVQTLVNMDHELLAGMESLETQFEAMHQRAEQLRRKMQERASALASAIQRRAASALEPEGMDMNTKTTTTGAGAGMNPNVSTHANTIPRIIDNANDDDGMNDLQSELAPDDSASCIAYTRSRAPPSNSNGLNIQATQNSPRLARPIDQKPQAGRTAPWLARIRNPIAGAGLVKTARNLRGQRDDKADGKVRKEKMAMPKDPRVVGISPGLAPGALPVLPSGNGVSPGHNAVFTDAGQQYRPRGSPTIGRDTGWRRAE